MKNFPAKSVLLLCILFVKLSSTDACTRVVYQGPNNTIVTGRTMDWVEDMKSNVWAFPKGIKRNGAVGVNSVEWIAKYGSVVTSGYEAGVADGMNEKGLVANLLYLAESNYGAWDGKKSGLSISTWAQYVLDNFATVNEAVSVLNKEPFHIIAPTIPNGMASTLHLAISDSLGDNAIFEYVNGKLVIHHSRSYQVMTNSPVYEQQLALNEYWKNIGGLAMLPGTNRAADRFVRASFYINAIPQTDDIHVAVAGVFSVIRNASVPLGISTPNQPNISSTIWRTVSDHKNKVYYFESTLSPNVFWVNLKGLDFSVGTSVKKLALSEGQIYSGNTAGLFKKTEAFHFLGQ